MQKQRQKKWNDIGPTILLVAYFYSIQCHLVRCLSNSGYLTRYSGSCLFSMQKVQCNLIWCWGSFILWNYDRLRLPFPFSVDFFVLKWAAKRVEIFLSFLKQILRDVPSQSSLLGRHGVHDSMPRCILPSLCISEEDCTTSLGTRFDVLGK